MPNYKKICVYLQHQKHNIMGTFIKLIHCFSSYYDDIRECASIKVSMIFFVALLSAFNMYGQAISELGCFNYIHGENALIQHLGSGTDAVIYYNNGSSHYLIGTSDSINYRYTLPSYPNSSQSFLPFGSIQYEIKDMMLIDNTLFLCGNMSEFSEEESYYTMTGEYVIYYHSYGFLMIVDVADIINPSAPNINVRIKSFSEISECNKIAVELAATDTLVGIVGADNNTSCLVCLTMKRPGENWIMKKYAMPDTAEVLTDLTFTDKSFATASRFGGETNTFGVRFTEKYRLFYNADLSNYKQYTKFNTTSSRGSCDNNNNAWHRNDATIRLVDMGNGGEVTVAYESRYYFYVGSALTFYNYLSLFDVDGCDTWHPIITKAKYMHSVPNYPEVFKDMKYNLYNDSIAILRRSLFDNTFASSVTLFSWNGSKAREIYSIDEDMSSFDILTTNLIAAANPRNNSSLEKYWKNTQYFTINCFPECLLTVCSYNPLPTSTTSTTILTNDEIHERMHHNDNVEGQTIHYVERCSRED